MEAIWLELLSKVLKKFSLPLLFFTVLDALGFELNSLGLWLVLGFSLLIFSQNL